MEMVIRQSYRIACLPGHMGKEWSRNTKQHLILSFDSSLVGSSDFPRSLCFVWFWFNLEILRLVYKKAFFKILIGFYLIWTLNFQKNSTIPYKSWKKNFFEIGRAGYQKKRNFALIAKMCRTLASRSSQRFFLRKTIFCKIFQVPKNSVFL